MQVTRLARLAIAAVLALGSLLLLPNPGSAQKAPTPQQIATARELLSLKHADLVFKPVIIGVVQSVKDVFVPTNPQLSKELNDVAVQLHKEYESSLPDLMNEVAKVYAEHFTEQELKELVAFYGSPVGKKLVNNEPTIIDESMSRSQTWGEALSGKVLNRFREEMKKKGHTLQ